MSIQLVKKINNLFSTAFSLQNTPFLLYFFEVNQYAPVAQLDSASDSDVSDRFRSDTAQSLGASEIEAAETKISMVVDYYLTTVFEETQIPRK